MISIWEKETFYAPQDVIIIGSGFVGLWSAFYLKKKSPRLKVTIIDRGLIPTGASTRNAGFACFGSLSELIHDAQTMGRDEMLELVEMRYRGLSRIQKFFDEDQIDFELCGGYELYDSVQVPSSTIQENIEYLNSLLKPITGTKKTYKLTDEKIGTFGFGQTTHLVKNNLEGYLHSGKLVQGLLQKVQGMGVHVYNRTSVQEFNKNGNHIEIKTDQMVSFRTKQLLICTNAFAKDLLPDEDIVPARGQVLVTTPIEGLPWNGTFHSDEGFYYFRNLGTRVLLGGARNKAFDDERTTEMVTSDFIQQELERYLREVVLPGYNGKYSIEHRWSGIMAMGAEKMPIVKQVAPQVFCAVRMSGMGVALAPVVGQQISELMLD
jgi:glycine/D-amino acid oxidase-like deaminating enzyme